MKLFVGNCIGALQSELAEGGSVATPDALITILLGGFGRLASHVAFVAFSLTHVLNFVSKFSCG